MVGRVGSQLWFSGGTGPWGEGWRGTACEVLRFGGAAARSNLWPLLSAPHPPVTLAHTRSSGLACPC